MPERQQKGRSGLTGSGLKARSLPFLNSSLNTLGSMHSLLDTQKHLSA